MMTEDQIRNYKKFMANIDNSHRCNNCPANEGKEGDVLPCGQYHCWVDVHNE